MINNTKKNYVKFFKELYNREPNKEELNAFIEYMQTRNGKKFLDCFSELLPKV